MMGSKILTTRDWQVRATTWELLAFSLRYPDRLLAEAVSSGEWADAALEVTGELEMKLPETFEKNARLAKGNDIDNLLHSLRSEATRLFVGVPDPAVSPYEGVWRAADDGVQALLFVNPHSMEVERFCKQCGLGRPRGTNEPLDHVATECELLEYLALLSTGIDTPTETGPTFDALPGGSPEKAYEAFLQDHARAWMPSFAEAVATETQQPFYRAVAQMLASNLR